MRHSLYLICTRPRANPPTLKWHPVPSPPLNPWKQYSQAKRESGSPLSLISSLLLCRLACYRTDWQEDNLVLLWHTICEDLVSLIDRALTFASPNPADSGEDEGPNLTKESQIALDILRDLDNHYRDDIRSYRDRAAGASPRDPDHLQSEDKQYSRWRDEYDVNKSLYTDGLIIRLLSIAGTDTVVDKDGFVLWRVRRLKDIRDKPYKAVIAGATYSTLQGTQVMAKMTRERGRRTDELRYDWILI